MSLLGLPSELLANVALFTTKKSLPALRLVCKYTDDVCFDEWAGSFLKERVCCPLDRASLLNLRHLTGTRRLAQKIDTMIWTLDLYINKREAMQDSIWHFDNMPYPDHWRQTMDDMWDDIKFETIDTKLLRSVLFDLKTTGYAAMKVDTEGGWDMDDSANFAMMIRASDDLWSSLLATGSLLTHVDFEVGFGPDLGRLHVAQTQKFSGMANTVKTVAYNACGDSSYDVASLLTRHRCFLEVIKHSENLESLTVEGVQPTRLAEAIDYNYCALGRCVFMSNDLHCLRELHLDGFHCRIIDLLHALHNCQATLQSISLFEVTMDGTKSQWEDVLCTLQVCPNIKSLKLGRLRYETQATAIKYIRLGDVDESGVTYKKNISAWLNEALDVGHDVREALRRLLETIPAYRA